MLELIDLTVFEVVVTLKLGVATSQRIGGFQQVVAKETVAGLNEAGSLGFKIAGLVLIPNKARVLGKGRLGVKAVDVADFGKKTGCVNRADSFNRRKRIGGLDAERRYNRLL